MITVDSLHVKGLVKDKFVARENSVRQLRHMWRLTRLNIRWVRGHTGGYHGNRNSSDRVRSRGARRTGLPRNGPTMVKLRKMCLDRRRKKDQVARKSLSIALCRARQVIRGKQADLRFKTATELGAPSRLKVAPPPTWAPILEKFSAGGHTDRIENLQGRTDIVHDHFKELLTDPLHWKHWNGCGSAGHGMYRNPFHVSTAGRYER